MKVFWSWQSDTPGKIGRFLIRDALKDAIEELKSALDVDEPVREALHLDQDRQGVPGSPELVRTILEKIDSSDVVIADVTAVATADGSGKSEDKKLINSNVAIELGYALRALTDRKIVMVFNEHFGKHEDLPFDLRHRGGAIVFNLAPGADGKQIAQAKEGLTARFVEALKLCVPEPVATPAPQFPETPHVGTRATYFSSGEVLAKIGRPEFDEVTYAYVAGPMCYLRLIPVARLKRPLNVADLNAAATSEHDVYGGF